MYGFDFCSAGKRLGGFHPSRSSAAHSLIDPACCGLTPKLSARHACTHLLPAQIPRQDHRVPSRQHSTGGSNSGPYISTKPAATTFPSTMARRSCSECGGNFGGRLELRWRAIHSYSGASADRRINGTNERRTDLLPTVARTSLAFFVFWSHSSNPRVQTPQMEAAMDRFVARQNIEHYRRQLACEEDETKRQMLLRLLADEEAKLAALGEPPKRKKA